jgi:chorismate mutase/prephenate dehydratase
LENQDIEQARSEIDLLDAQIVQLLQIRARAAQLIGVAKAQDGRSAYAPDRERHVLDWVSQAGAAGPLTADNLGAIYRQVISACRSLEAPLRVGYFGPAATFTHQAALDRFGASASLIAIETIPEIFAETQRGRVDFGVVPVENSTEGPVHPTLDTLIDSELKIRSEIVLPISLQLMGRGSIDEVKTLYSNPVALGQCRGWVAQHLRGCRIVDAVSTARAAQMAAEDPSGAAIGPRLAASQYGLEILAENVGDLSSNYTRFYVVGPAIAGAPTGRDKTAAMFSIHDHIGALRDVADVFARYKLNMSSIQSRPSRRRVWDYVFFVEFAGHEQDPVVRQAIDELARQCAALKLLGSWPVEA